ncbi:Alpha/Beta hydrolase protein [Trichoderma pleuroticola]
MAGLQSRLPEILSGRYDDGPLVGLGYQTASQQGVTDKQGRFFYQDGEPSLAVERDLRNGVSIDDTVRDIVNRHADGISFTSAIDTFEQSPAVRAVFSELGSRFRGVEEARNHLRRAQAGIKALIDVRVPAHDNNYLLADVFHPVDAARYPVLRDNLHPYWRWSENAASASPSVWVPRGYVVVLVDGRGVGNVPGKLSPYSEQEARNDYDATEWAAKQTWSDGNHVAALHPPSLKAMAPISADGDIRDLTYSGGTFLEGYRRWWWNELVLPVKLPDTEVEYYVGGLRSHPWDDDIDIPVLTAVSMANTIHPRCGFEAFSGLSSRIKRLMVMDAVYSGNMYQDFQPDLEAFFDQYLKGKKLAEEPPTVRMVLRTGDGGWQWRSASTWPVPNTEYRELFLEATNAGVGHISTRAPSQEEVAEYSADQDVELVGHFRAMLWVSSTTSDADVFVALRVMDGEREIPYRTYDTVSAAPLTWDASNTTERPWHPHRREDAQLLVPGEVAKIDVEIMPATGRVL